MNLYEYVKGQAQPGWPVTHAPGGPPAVLVGEEGRGRILVRLPLLTAEGALALSGPSRFCAGEGQPYTATTEEDGAFGRLRHHCPSCEGHSRWLYAAEGPHVVPRHDAYPMPPTRTERVSHASLVRRGGTWGVMPCESGGTAVAVLIRDQSGFRGSWELKGKRGYTCTGPAVEGECPRCGRTAASRYSKLSADHASSWEDAPRVIARGYCAQGDAGRAGGGPELIVVLADGEECWIDRTGRLYGAPALVRLRNVGGTVEVKTLAEVEEEQADARPVEEILQ